MINLSNYKPFYYFNTPTRYNNLNKSTLIKVNGVSHYLYK